MIMGEIPHSCDKVLPIVVAEGKRFIRTVCWQLGPRTNMDIVDLALIP